MTKREIVAINFYPSDTEIPPRLTKYERDMYRNSLYGSLKKHTASKGFAIFPHRPGIRFFADSDELIDLAGKEHHLVLQEGWSNNINELRFHDGFVMQIEIIDNKIWLKIDPRQTVLIKGNEQSDRDFFRSHYVSYCPFSDCENRSECILARPKTLKEVHFSRSKREVTSLKEQVGFGCEFFGRLRDTHDVVEAEWRRKRTLIPSMMMYFKGAIVDMPSWNLRKLYQQRCLLKSKDRLALTQFAFSVLSDNEGFFNVRYGEDEDEISFQNMFRGKADY